MKQDTEMQLEICVHSFFLQICSGMCPEMRIECYQQGQMLALNAEEVGQTGTSYHRLGGNQAYQPT